MNYSTNAIPLSRVTRYLRQSITTLIVKLAPRSLETILSLCHDCEIPNNLLT